MSQLYLHLDSMNIWAILAAALAAFLLAALWYSPALFADAWMDANGLTETQVSAIQKDLGAVGFGAAFFSYLFLAAAFAALVAVLKIDSVLVALILAVVLWSGFVASSGLAVNLFSPRPIAAWVIDAGYQLTALAVTATIVALWR